MLSEANVVLFFRFVAERQRVYQKWHSSAPAPWTADPTIAGGRFCNVFRYLDRESVWAVAHIITPLLSRPADLVFNILIFRTYLNWHRSMELLGLQSAETFERAAFETRLRQVGAQLGKLSSAAYNVGSFHGFASVDHGGAGSKPGRVAAMFAALAPKMSGVVAAILERRDSEFTCSTISGLEGVGPFVGWQVCLDLGYWMPGLYNESLHVKVGPGAEKGLRWIFSSTGGLSDTACIHQLMQSQNRWFDQAGVDAAERQRLFGDMPRPPMPLQQGQDQPGPLNLMALEGCLCEGNKYLRTHTQTGYGRTKQKYSASTGADARYHADYAVMMSTLASSWTSGASTTQLELAPTAGKVLLPPALSESTMQRMAAPALEDGPSSDPFAVPELTAAAIAAAAEWRPPSIIPKPWAKAVAAGAAAAAAPVAVLQPGHPASSGRTHRNVRSVYIRAPAAVGETDTLNSRVKAQVAMAKRKAPPDMPKGRKPLPQLVPYGAMLSKLAKRKDAAPFAKPMNELWDPADLDGYFQIIKQPMDLRTVVEKLRSGEYNDCGHVAFAEDTRLVFKNCMTFTQSPVSPYHKQAKAMLALFDREYSVIANAPVAGAKKGRGKIKVFEDIVFTNPVLAATAAPVTWLGQMASIETQLGTVCVGDHLEVVWHADGQHYPANVRSIWRADADGVAMSGSVFELTYTQSQLFEAWTEWLPLAEFTPARVTFGIPPGAKSRNSDAKKRLKSSGGSKGSKKRQKVEACAWT